MGSAASKPVVPAPASSTSSEKVRLDNNNDGSGKTTHPPFCNEHRAGRWSHSASSRASNRAEETVTLDAVKQWSHNAFADPAARVASMTMHNANITTSVRVRNAEVANVHVFNHSIPSGHSVSSQRRSGRCWIFATCNLIRYEVENKLKLENFELSQSYLHFWDKVEKYNYFLENMIDTADLDLDSRLVNSLLSDPTGDGGQWDMVRNLLDKYGVVPQSVYPESFNTSDTTRINWLCKVKLREYALELRSIKREMQERLDRTASSLDESTKAAAIVKAQRQRKDEQMAEIYRMLAIAMGEPPKPDEEFTFVYTDKDAKYGSVTATPLSFLRDQTNGFDHRSKCSLVNDPRNPLDRTITISRLGNVWGGDPVLYVNTSMEQMTDSVVQSIKAGKPVFFGCDVGQFSETSSGIMDPKLYDYELPFGIKLGLSKAQRIQTGESAMTHAMVITAVHVDEKSGKVVRYKVENSWGAENVGEKGYMVMTQEWFRQFAYQVVVDRKFMPKHLWALYEGGVTADTIVLPPYDPMGALA